MILADKLCIHVYNQSGITSRGSDVYQYMASKYLCDIIDNLNRQNVQDIHMAIPASNKICYGIASK